MPKSRVPYNIPKPKPCPTCYAPMTLNKETGEWECPKHGKPTKL